MKYPNLEAEMKRADITRQDLADRLGIHISGVYLMFQGKREITVARAKEIRDIFFPGMSLDYLYGEIENKAS